MSRFCSCDWTPNLAPSSSLLNEWVKKFVVELDNPYSWVNINNLISASGCNEVKFRIRMAGSAIPGRNSKHILTSLLNKNNQEVKGSSERATSLKSARFLVLVINLLAWWLLQSKIQHKAGPHWTLSKGA